MKFGFIDLIIASMDEHGVEKGTHVERIYFDERWRTMHHKKIVRLYVNAVVPNPIITTKLRTASQSLSMVFAVPK